MTQQSNYKNTIKPKKNAGLHNIQEEDNVLFLQKKIKSKPQNEPKLYTVTEVVGKHITA